MALTSTKESRRIWRRKYESSSHGKSLRRILFERRREAREKLFEKLKSKPCKDCRHRFPPECMDFDHVRGLKRIKISTNHMNHKWETVLKEIAKCDLVCSNCHRIRTKKRGWRWKNHAE